MTTWKSKDTLFAKLLTPTIQDKFYWVTHGYTHLAFFNLTYFDTNIELLANTYFINKLGLPGKSYYSPGAMITPRISGVFNGYALQAIKDNGISSIVGDNSYAAMLPWENRYWGWTTNATKNGFDGMFVIPRFALNVYFNMASFQSNLNLYNAFYNQTLGVTSMATFFEREAFRCASQLVALLHDPYMLHQANLKFSSNPLRSSTVTNMATASLGTLWAELTLLKVIKFLRLPIITLKQDDLAAHYKKRQAFDKCAVDATLDVADATGAISSVSLKGAASCTAPLSGIAISGLAADAVYSSVETTTDIAVTTTATAYTPAAATAWVTTSVPAAPTATTVLKNPYFSNNMDYWWAYGTGYTLSSEVISGKTNYFAVLSAPTSTANVGFFQAVDLTGAGFTAGPFTIGAYIQTSNLVVPAGSNAGFYVDITWSDGSLTTVTANLAPGSLSSWTFTSIVVNKGCLAPSKFNVFVMLRNGATGTLNIDNLVLYKGIQTTDPLTSPAATLVAAGAPAATTTTTNTTTAPAVRVLRHIL